MKVRLFVALAGVPITNRMDVALINLHGQADSDGYVDDVEWATKCLGLKLPNTYTPGVGADDDQDFLKARHKQQGHVHVLVFPRSGSDLANILGVTNRFVVYSAPHDGPVKSFNDLHNCQIFPSFESARAHWDLRCRTSHL